MPIAPTAFDTYLAVDWSAAATPTSGRDSIWIAWGAADGWRPAVDVPRAGNPQTRFVATEQLRALLRAAVADRRRVLVGFDFPLGYPRGSAAAFGLTGPGDPWERIWGHLAERLVDTRLNGNDRFEVAAELNAASDGDGPFWGCSPAYERGQEVVGESLLHRGKRVAPYGGDRPAEWRRVEARLRERGWRPAAVWQLAGAGAVGSQSLTGIPRVRSLRTDRELAAVSRVWPFEIGVEVVAAGDGPLVVHAEIWPRLFEADWAGRRPGPADRTQVCAVVDRMRRVDAAGRLAAWLAPSQHLAGDDRDGVLGEEGWVLGAP